MSERTYLTDTANVIDLPAGQAHLLATMSQFVLALRTLRAWDASCQVQVCFAGTSIQAQTMRRIYEGMLTANAS